MSPENSTVQEWSVDGLLDEIQKLNANMKDRSLAFILGAGASVTSGIPAGGTLAQTWLKEIYLRKCLNQNNEPFESWAAKALEIDNFQLAHAATHYSKIFELRFAGDPKSGYAALEAEMEKAEPSLGYSILAKILDGTRHKVVVTTNFDNLIADALAIHAFQHPLIVGHESLAGFVRPLLPRPLVAKIHRDLHLHPKNDQNGVDVLEKGWEEALRGLFQHYTPLVIGYGGNDGSLMGLLDALPRGHIPGRLFWCYREGGRPKDDILKIIEKHNGILVSIAGFDEFMIQLVQILFEGFDLRDIAKNIENLGKKRAERYQTQADTLLEQLAKADTPRYSIATDKARQSISEASHDDTKWWNWELRAKNEKDVAKREIIYQQALKAIPNNPDLLSNYANFLAHEHRDYEKAQELYTKALDLAPNDGRIAGNYAYFLTISRKDYDKAEEMYLKALELDPSRIIVTCNYAIFLAEQRNNYDKAEEMYLKALELNPNYVRAVASYATFLTMQREDYNKAEAMYLKALELDPNDVSTICNYAIFLTNQRRDYNKAESMYLKALDLAPNNAMIAGNYANFLAEHRKDYDKAEAMYLTALELNPNYGSNFSNYALFLADQRNNYEKAEDMFVKALELNPNDANATGNYAIFIASQHNDYAKAEAMCQKVFELDPNDQNITSNLCAAFLVKGDDDDALKRVPPLVRHAIEQSRALPSSPAQALAESLLYGCLYSELTTREPGDCVGRLKSILNQGFERETWDFSAVFESTLPKIDAERRALYIAIGDAILNAEKVPELDSFALWRDTPPSDPFAPY